MLSKIADVAVIALLVLTGYALYSRPATPVAPALDYKAGDAVRTSFDSTAKTLVIVASTTCPHCVKTLPTYKALASEAAGRGTKVVALTSDDVAKFRDWLGIDVATIQLLPKSGLKVRGVPTTFVLEGKRVKAYEPGELDDKAVGRIRKALSTPYPSWSRRDSARRSSSSLTGVW
jgi:thiol-disulfide isomerase/thioredoxin